jgi:hypothetical protein
MAEAKYRIRAMGGATYCIRSRSGVTWPSADTALYAEIRTLLT